MVQISTFGTPSYWILPISSRNIWDSSSIGMVSTLSHPFSYIRSNLLEMFGKIAIIGVASILREEERAILTSKPPSTGKEAATLRKSFEIQSIRDKNCFIALHRCVSAFRLCTRGLAGAWESLPRVRFPPFTRTQILVVPWKILAYELYLCSRKSIGLRLRLRMSSHFRRRQVR